MKKERQDFIPENLMIKKKKKILQTSEINSHNLRKTICKIVRDYKDLKLLLTSKTVYFIFGLAIKSK